MFLKTGASTSPTLVVILAFLGVIASAIPFPNFSSSLTAATLRIEDDSVDDTAANYSTISCNDTYWTNSMQDQALRWNAVDVEDAWIDALAYWNNQTAKYGADKLVFVLVISNFLHGDENMDCSVDGDNSNCLSSLDCDAGRNPAGTMILNSFVEINREMEGIYSALQDAAAAVERQMGTFVSSFCKMPQKDIGLDIVLDIISLGAGMLMAPLFNDFIKSFGYFVAHEDQYGDLKEITSDVVGAAINTAKELLSDGASGYQAVAEDTLNVEFNDVVTWWGYTFDNTTSNLFNGSKASTDMLWSMMSGGKLIEGIFTPTVQEPSTVTAYAQRALWGYLIPAAWTYGGAGTFILDSGVKCGTVNPLTAYLTIDTGDATWVCYTPTNRMYYLVAPTGDAQDCFAGAGSDIASYCTDNMFSEPPGFNDVTAGTYGGIKMNDLVVGSVAGYLDHSSLNMWNASAPTTVNGTDEWASVNITAPGYIKLPVCNASEAWNNWLGGKTKLKNYPCDDK